MKPFKSHFDWNRSQRNGIFILLLILVGSLVFQHFWMLPQNKQTEFLISNEDKFALQEQIDSIKKAEHVQKKPQIFPFNPNYLNDYRAYQLGISVEELDRLLSYRKNNNWVNSAEDFQEVTKVSDSLLNEIKPYFKFPKWVEEREKNTSRLAKSKPEKKTFDQKKDLNQATLDELKNISGVGEVLATRIIRTRSKFNGFIDDIQLKDVYGLNFETREKILNEFTVKLENKPSKMDINKANLVQLAELPYFDYELAREIVQFIQVRQGISDFEELAKIYEFPMHKIDRIKLYLTINE